MKCKQFNEWCDSVGLMGVAHLCKDTNLTYNYIRRLYTGKLKDVGILKIKSIIDVINGYPSGPGTKLKLEDFINE